MGLRFFFLYEINGNIIIFFHYCKTLLHIILVPIPIMQSFRSTGFGVPRSTHQSLQPFVCQTNTYKSVPSVIGFERLNSPALQNLLFALFLSYLKMIFELNSSHNKI